MSKSKKKRLKNLKVIGDPSQGIRIRVSIREVLNYFAFVSHVEPKMTFEAKKMQIG